MWQIFMDRYSEGEFHVLVKELKLFDHEFFLKHIATRHFDSSQQCFIVFVLFNNLLHSTISLADNIVEYCRIIYSTLELNFFQFQNEKKNFQFKEKKLLCF